MAGAVVHLALIAVFFTAARRRLSGAFKRPPESQVLLILAVVVTVVSLILATGRGRQFAVGKCQGTGHRWPTCARWPGARAS